MKPLHALQYVLLLAIVANELNARGVRLHSEMAEELGVHVDDAERLLHPPSVRRRRPAPREEDQCIFCGSTRNTKRHGGDHHGTGQQVRQSVSSPCARYESLTVCIHQELGDGVPPSMREEKQRVLGPAIKQDHSETHGWP